MKYHKLYVAVIGVVLLAGQQFAGVDVAAWLDVLIAAATGVGVYKVEK